MQKLIEIDGLDQPVILARRKGTRNLKISVKSDGRIRLSVPHGVPEIFAKKYLISKIDWIKSHQKPKLIISNGAHIGKSHTLIIKYSNANQHSTKITNTDILVNIPSTLDLNGHKAQSIIKKACEKALLFEAKKLLPQRLNQISDKHQITYKSYLIKKLKSRWGACDTEKNISLNSYLIQLDWELIDYVICHELAHTIYQNHQSDFWSKVEEIYPNYKEIRKLLKSKPTDILLSGY